MPYQENLVYDERSVARNDKQVLARFETIIPDKEFSGRKLEYMMNNEEITVSGKEETREAANIFKIPSDWVNTPHLRIRYNSSSGKFQLASLGEKTIVNEQEVVTSTPGDLHWIELPINSRMVLNGIVGINIFKA